MTETLPPLVSAMTKKEFYPHCPHQVELRQTHISYVFLAGEYVYKIKKPVRFAFLDYSTLDKRFDFCLEEVRLNRRLAPKTYLGVVAIYRKGQRFAVEDGSVLADNATVAEYAVKMHRLPEERILNRLLVEGTVTKQDIRAIVKKLVSFHLSAATKRASIYGTPEAIPNRSLITFRRPSASLARPLVRKCFIEFRTIA